MHNLGLGGLEFNPTHTIDEHRPVGFKLLNVIEDGEQSQRNSNASANGAELAEITDTTTAQFETPPADDFRETDDSIDENIFRLLHDPKHRHPRHHGLSLSTICAVPSFSYSI